MIYLDNASTTKIDQRVLEAMMPFLTNEYGNAGTMHTLGRRAKDAVERARSQVAELIGAEPNQIVFTSGGTEANNMVFFSLLDCLKTSQKTHIITASNEHVSILNSVRNLCIKHGFDATYINPNESGSIELQKVYDALKRETGLVSIMKTNNETGAKNPVSEIGGQLCNANGVLFHTDCVQAAGCDEIDVKKIGCDFLSLSSHKIHGPKGVGALYMGNMPLCSPMIHGGSAQEFGLRGGTENVAGIVGFGEACSIVHRDIGDVRSKVSSLKKIFYDALCDYLEKDNLLWSVHVNGPSIDCDGKVLNLRFDGIDGETLLLLLDAKGICISAGSACQSHESAPSHVLLSMGLSPENARNSIRVSFSRMNTKQEVEIAAREISGCIKELHGMCANHCSFTTNMI